MDQPTAADVRTWGLPNTPWAEWGYVEGLTPDSLERVTAAAAQQTLNVTGWGTWGAVPPQNEPLLEHAVTIMTQMFAAQSTPEYLETLSDFDLIQSFSAGSYSETRRSVDEAIKAKMLAAWPAAHAALFAAMTPDARDAYLAYLNGANVPGFETTEVLWGGSPYGVDPETAMATQYDVDAPWWPVW